MNTSIEPPVDNHDIRRLLLTTADRAVDLAPCRRPAIVRPARAASRPCGTVLALGHPEMDRLPAAQRHCGDAVQRRVQAASAGWPLRVSSASADGVHVRFGRSLGARFSGSRIGHALRRVGTAGDDLHRRTDCPGRLADPYHLGRNGIVRHGVGTRPLLSRLRHPEGARWREHSARHYRGVTRTRLIDVSQHIRPTMSESVGSRRGSRPEGPIPA